MGRFDDAVQLAASTGGPPDTAAVCQDTSRGGISANLEQRISQEIAAFARAGIANGNIEPHEFTDIDRTVAAGCRCPASRGMAGRHDGDCRRAQRYHRHA